MEVRKEVIDRLRKDPGPVDGVNGAEAMFGIKFFIPKESFDNILCARSVQCHMTECKIPT